MYTFSTGEWETREISDNQVFCRRSFHFPWIDGVGPVVLGGYGKFRKRENSLALVKNHRLCSFDGIVEDMSSAEMSDSDREDSEDDESGDETNFQMLTLFKDHNTDHTLGAAASVPRHLLFFTQSGNLVT